MRVLTAADYRSLRWKNDRGTTTELVRRPASEQSAFDWRISIADIVEDGAFSPFDGYERTIIVIEGDGIALRHGDRDEVMLRPFDVHRFAGEEATTVRLLGGSTRDFNVMTQRGRVVSATEVVSLRAGQETSGEATLLYVCSGDVRVRSADSEVGLKRGESLLLDGVAKTRIRSLTHAMLISVRIEQPE